MALDPVKYDYDFRIFGLDNPLPAFLGQRQSRNVLLHDLFETERMPFFSRGGLLDDDVRMFLNPNSEVYTVHEVEDGNSYQILVPLPGQTSASDLTLSVEEDGSVIHISGSKKIKNDEGEITSHSTFDKRFTIPKKKKMDVEKMVANVSDGVLILTAPKKEVTDNLTWNIPVIDGPYESREDRMISKL